MDRYNYGKIPKDCLWYDICECEVVCDDFTSTDFTDEEEQYIENEKVKFRHEFFEYAEENGLYE